MLTLQHGTIFSLTYIQEICSHQQTSAITESLLKLLNEWTYK